MPGKLCVRGNSGTAVTVLPYKAPHAPRRRLGMKLLSSAMCMALVVSSLPTFVWAQDAASATSSAPAASADDQNYSAEQLDALLAPIALYPDQLLTQILMASTYPDQIKAANSWVQQPANKSLTGDALDKALAPQDWDPSVKSLVPFPQVLDMMSTNADWTAQLAYAMEVQQNDVLDSVQRLRKQAQEAGQLKSTAQQTVSTEGSAIIIAPAQPNVVYVPSYNPTVVYGTWPYPSYPPVYYPPPPAYGVGDALLRGMAFGTGVAITASLWGWATPHWGGGYGYGHGNINVNVNRYNNINVNRAQIHTSNWNASNRPGGRRPPQHGPVGKPSRQGGLPANSVGRNHVSVPGNVTRPPAGIGPGKRPPVAKAPIGGGHPSIGQNGGRPAMNQPHKPVSRPGTRPAASNRASGPGAFHGMSDGRSASQFGSRGAQSQRMSAARNGGARAGGGGWNGGGGRAGGGRHR